MIAKRTIVIIATVSAMIIMAGLFVYMRLSSTVDATVTTEAIPGTYRPVDKAAPVHRVATVTVDDTMVTAAIDRADSSAFKGTIVGGVVPHHDIAGEHMAAFFKTLATQPVDRIVLLVPDHREIAPSQVVTGYVDWKVNDQVMVADAQGIDALTAAGVADASEVIATEHAFPAVMPYIAHFLPEAQVVPIAFRATEQQAVVDRMVGLLGDLCQSRCVVVAAIDFSHYLTEQQATAHDAITLEALRSHDAAALLAMNADYVDSGVAAAVVTAMKKDLVSFWVLKQGNSADYPPFDTSRTTSYITGVFVQGW